MTGKTYYEQNIRQLPDDLRPILQRRIADYNRRLATGNINASPDDIARAGVPGTHSEIIALDKAIKAREAFAGRPVSESELSHFLLHNRSLTPVSAGTGVPPRCANCWDITEGVTVIGND